MMDLVLMMYLVIIFVVLYFTSFQLLIFIKFRRKIEEKPKEIKELPKVSLIVPAYNEEKNIERLLRNILKLSYPREKLEVIVVDDGSKDKTFEKAKKFEKFGVKVVKKKHEGKAAALNFGLKLAKGEIIGCVDCDTILEKDALTKCIKYFNDTKVASVTSRILQRRKRKMLERWQDIELKIIAFTRKLTEPLNIITATPGPLSLYRKDVLIKVGGFDEKCVLEDNEIAWRLLFYGYKIRMSYDVKVYTRMPSTLKGFWKQRTRWGIGGLQIIRKYFFTFLRHHPVGTFLLPSWIIGYTFSSVGLLLFFYLLFYSLYINVSYYILTLLHGGNPFIFSFNFQVNLLLIYGIILFFLSTSYLLYVLQSYRETKLRIFDILTFIFLFLPLYPLITFYSIFKFLWLRKQLKTRVVWLTK
jgi:cellulose synthase/poly-beta-1,6-N-acetylglucosamine synthase-like glycosyltransferase